MAGVQHINYNGKKMPIKLGVFTMMLVQEEHGIIVGDEKLLENEDGSELRPSQYIPLLHHALQQGHRLVKKPFNLELEDMHDILNECFFEFVAAIPEFFPSGDEMMEKIQGVTGKEGQKGKGGQGGSTTTKSSGKQQRTSASGQKKRTR